MGTQSASTRTFSQERLTPSIPPASTLATSLPAPHVNEPDSLSRGGDRVIATLTVQGVAPAATLDVVVADELVGAAVTDEKVEPGAAVDQVGSRRTAQPVRESTEIVVAAVS
jgi:hypothetical protein